MLELFSSCSFVMDRGAERTFEILPRLAFMPHFSRYIIFKGAQVSKRQTNASKTHRPINVKEIIYSQHEVLILEGCKTFQLVTLYTGHSAFAIDSALGPMNLALNPRTNV